VQVLWGLVEALSDLAAGRATAGAIALAIVRREKNFIIMVK
jgi:hypothetical protein